MKLLKTTVTVSYVKTEGFLFLGDTLRDTAQDVRVYLNQRQFDQWLNGKREFTLSPYNAAKFAKYGRHRKTQR